MNSVPDVVSNSTAVAGDTTAPTLSRAVTGTNGLYVLLEFSENLQASNLPLASAFTATADGNTVTVPSIAQRGGQDSFWVFVEPAIRQGQAVVVTYTDPSANDDTKAIQDTSGNDAASASPPDRGQRPRRDQQLHPHQHRPNSCERHGDGEAGHQLQLLRRQLQFHGRGQGSTDEREDRDAADHGHALAFGHGNRVG